MAIKNMKDGLKAGRKDKKFSEKDGNKYKHKYFKSMAKVKAMETSYTQFIYHKYKDENPSDVDERSMVVVDTVQYQRSASATATAWAGTLVDHDPIKTVDGHRFIWNDGRMYEINVDAPEEPGGDDIVTAVVVPI